MSEKLPVVAGRRRSRGVEATARASSKASYSRRESVKEFIFDGEVAGNLPPNSASSKFGFLRSSRAVLDLCAAPGGWMQVAVERVPFGILVVGVDLDSICPIRGAIVVQEYITTTKCRSTVKKLMAEHDSRAFDLVLHDGSPNVGGASAIFGKKKRHNTARLTAIAQSKI